MVDWIDNGDGTWTVVHKDEQAKIDAANMPGWSTWTWDEAEAWILANVAPELGSQPKTLTAINKMAQMLIYLRDGVWPDLT